MIIDCHGHYTTAPKALENWRNRQIAGINDPSAKSRPSELKISDDELRESIEGNQLRLMRERGLDLTIFSPRASFMAHHIGDFASPPTWAAICNELCYPVWAVVSRPFHRRGDAAAKPRGRSEDLHPELEKCVQRLRVHRHQSQPGPVRRPLDQPAADRPLLVSDLREDGRIRHPRNDPCFARVAMPCFHTTGAHYI